MAQETSSIPMTYDELLWLFFTLGVFTNSEEWVLDAEQEKTCRGLMDKLNSELARIRAARKEQSSGTSTG
jgi:hypothetical protein